MNRPGLRRARNVYVVAGQIARVWAPLLRTLVAGTVAAMRQAWAD